MTQCRRCNRLIRNDRMQGWLPVKRGEGPACPVAFPDPCQPEEGS